MLLSAILIMSENDLCKGLAVSTKLIVVLKSPEFLALCPINLSLLVETISNIHPLPYFH